jgi:hypothetical protein
MFCSLLKFLIEHAPEHLKARLQAIHDEHCGTVTVNSGDNGPPPGNNGG